MSSSLRLEIITPERVFYKGVIKMVVVRTLFGEEAFLHGHLPAVKLLDTGELAIQENDSAQMKIASISGGFVDVKDSVIVIYTDRAEWSEEIDKVRAETARDAAIAWLKENSHADTEEKVKRELTIKRAKSRINVSEGGRRGKQ